jgi:hypothetical protein
MTFDEWLDEKNAEGKTTRDCINEEVDMARVMTGSMSHNLARRRLYDWLETAYICGRREAK